MNEIQPLEFSDSVVTPSLYVGMWERERRLVELALEHERLIDRATLTEAGVTAQQWRRHIMTGLWVEQAPGVWRHLATADTWHLRVRAALRWLGTDAALWGSSALTWWGIVRTPPEAIDVIVPRARRRHTDVVRLHTAAWRPQDYRRKDGVRLQEPATAIVSVADEVDVRALEGLIDDGVRARLISFESLRSAIERSAGSGHPGIRTLRSLLLDTGGESYLERRFLALVRRGRLPRPTCQVVHRRGSEHIARVDFLFPCTDIVVEVTGRLGHATDSERRGDARRRNALQRAGRVVLEFTTADVLEGGEHVLETLREWLTPELPLG